MKFWLVEDLIRVRDYFHAQIAAKAPGVKVIDLPNFEEAEASIVRISDEDVVSLDSQLPVSAATPNQFDSNAGVRVAAMIRAGGKRCHLFWHSTAALPDEIRSWGGIQQSVADIVDFVVSSAKMPRPAVVPPDVLDDARNFLRRMQGYGRALVALDILCVGILAAGERAASPEERPQIDLDVGIQHLRAAVDASNGRYWAELGESHADASVRDAVAIVRQFYERYSEEASATVEMRREDVDCVHQAFKTLWPRSCL